MRIAAYRPMRKPLLRTCLCAFFFGALINGARARDALSEYFLVVGSIKAKPADQYSVSDFVREIHKLEDEYSKRCGAAVFAWHSDLVRGFRSGFWFLYTISDKRKSMVDAFPRQDHCSQAGYVKKGSMNVPDRYLACIAVIGQPQNPGC